MRKVLEILEPLEEKGILLDIGCGHTYLKMILPKGIEYLGLDLTATSRNVIKYDLNIGTLPFTEGVFDYVVCVEVLEHTFVPDKICKEIERVLKPGGVSVISLPNEFTLDNRLRFLLGINWIGSEQTGHHWFFDFRAARRFLRERFRVVREYPYFACKGGRYIPEILRGILIGMMPILFCRCLFVKARRASS